LNAVDAGEVCPVNLGPRGISQRRVLGIAALILGALVALGLAFAGAPRVFRAMTFAPFWLGALGLFQAQAKTCVSLASRGLRDFDDGTGPVAVADAAEDRALRAQARRVHWKALLLAIALTGATFLLPGGPPPSP
jgi:hypothetical protein